MLRTTGDGMPPQAARGAITLISVVVLSTLTLALAGALFVLLMAGHQAIGQRLEREIAFRGAELALLDGEHDLLSATAPIGGTAAIEGAAAMAGTAASAPPAGRNDRLGSWPAPGRCGAQAQRGLCSPALGQPPPWRAWIDQPLPADAIGVPVGNVTGATLPVIPAEMAGATTVPRYLIERLPPNNTGGSAPAGVPPQRYRITALGQGRDPAARVVLQTEWIEPEWIDPSSRRAAASQPGGGRVRRLGWRELVPPYPS